jgi:hypothetical protein
MDRFRGQDDLPPAGCRRRKAAVPDPRDRWLPGRPHDDYILNCPGGGQKARENIPVIADAA